jgi:hypothetical protein
MPWTVATYDTPRLDLTNPATFRKLNVPIGRYGDARKKDIRRRKREQEGAEFYYTSYVSSPICLYLWLMRMEPFTTLHIQMQSGKFDHAARLFGSIRDAWRIATAQINDFRELVPEFYFQPEFLVNSNNFDLGKDPSGGCVNHVTLPAWATSPLEFVYLHRKALESDVVSETICQWIDLIWGYLQRGPAAKKAKNTYDPHMYPTAWTEDVLKDPNQCAMVEAAMEQCGQVPEQLFRQPHPQRLPRSPRVVESIQVQLPVNDVIFVNLRPVSNLHDFAIISLNEETVFQKWLYTHSTQKMQPLPIGSLKIERKTITGISPVDDCRLAIGRRTGAVDVVDISSAAIFGLDGNTGRVNCVAADRRNVVSGGSDTISHCWFVEDFGLKPHRVPSFRGEIVCVCLSLHFNVWVCGTSDGAIMVLETRRGIVTRVIPLENKARPSRVLVTPEWGFIVVYLTDVVAGKVRHSLAVFSINGEAVRTCEIRSGIVAWAAFASEDAFDFIVFADEDGAVFVSEAFYLDVKEYMRVREQVLSIYYSRRDDMVIVVTKTGKIYFESRRIETQ